MAIQTGASSWDLMELAIKAWINRYPDDWIDFTALVQQERQKLRDAKFATNKTNSMRRIAVFPVVEKDGKEHSLLFYLQKIEPTLMTTKGRKITHEFLRKFSAFRLPEKI